MILTTLPTTNVRTARRGDGGLHPGTPSQVTLSAGAGQTAIAGAAVAIAPAVLVRDQLDRPVAGVPMQFVVVGGSSASQVTVDGFIRANENPLAGTWSKAGGAATNLQLLNNAIRGVTASGEGLMYSTAATWPADQYSECQLLVGDPGGGGPAVRMSAGAESAYIAQTTVGVVSLCKFVAGAFTLLQQVGATVGSTDTLRLEARGSTLRMYKNGVQLGTDVLDASLSTGAPGLDLFSNTTFTITRWAAGVPPTTSGTVTPDTPVVTDAAGVAAVTAWTLGTVPGVNTLTVTSAGLVGSPVSVTATGTGGAGVATQIAINAGNNQSAVAGTNVATPPSVIVRDAGGAPVAGVLVTFAVASGGGSVTGASQNTNASGIATVGSWTLGAAAGTNTLTASSAGLTGSPVTVTATGTTPVVFDFYVSPTGGTGTGAIGDPWSLSYALGGAGGTLTPGKIVALRGGTYTGTFVSAVAGTAANPIIFRQYPTEHATIVGQIRLITAYLVLWGFEIAGAQAPGPLSCVDMQAVGCKLINMVMHDATDEIVGYFHGAAGAELYGCIGYNAGPAQAATPNAYSWYINNDTTLKRLTDCIGFNSYQYITHLYDAGLGQLNNLALDGCVGWGGGAIRSPRNTQANLVVAGGPGNNLHITNCHFYEGASPDITWSAWIAASGDDLVLDGNIFTGFTSIGNWTNAIVNNNTFYSLGASPVGGDLLNVQTAANIAVWSKNTHFRDSTANAWMRNGAPANGTSSNFAAWKTATGLGTTDTNAAAPSGSQIIIRPNTYESGRAHIIAYNWAAASSVTADVSNVLSIGQSFSVYNVQDFYGSAVTGGVYAGAAITIPMAGITPPVPLYGRSYTTAPVTGPIFQVFVLIGA